MPEKFNPKVNSIKSFTKMWSACGMGFALSICACLLLGEMHDIHADTSFENVPIEKQQRNFLVQVYVHRIRQLIAEGDMFRAKAQFEKARVLDPESVKEFESVLFPELSAVPMFKKAKSSLFINEKIAYCKKALELDANFLQARIYLAHCFYKIKQYASAKEELLQVLSQNPDHKKSQKLLAKIEKKMPVSSH